MKDHFKPTDFWNSSVLFWSIGLFVMLYALGFFMIFRKWKGRDRFEAASCGLSLVHGIVCTVLATYDVVCTEWKLDAPNTLLENKIMEFSIAYFIVDFLHYLYAAPDDYLFILHHIATSTYMFSCRYYTCHGAKSATSLIAVGEITSPLQNIWTLARMARNESPFARQIYLSLSPPFTFIFTFFRVFVGPYMLWELGKFYLTGKADAVIPTWLAYSWILKSALAVCGSMIWVYKLWVGLYRFYTRQHGRDKKAA
ncbi:hypothetical protein O6H91_20G008200 [Diphasiastrum complanatum]|uniref:Uncharacterized protein n=2 Tax=Diphasiastrum complanatum TaxID=34168 RepID=A0ACC2AMJ2_DIPCM|nr:hypothetical protein O6H91_20G007900 [Diphasiastrum complanatum]KAJ7518779.1 hypothetical protein O6H91_20G008200 [Diphasiastrum complanatum]